jgi:threonine synthase
VMNDGDGPRTGEQLARFRESGVLTVPSETRERWITGAFRAARSSDAEVLEEIRRVHASTGLLIDPHTAAGTRAARLLAGEHPVITMATAHPAKFPDAVKRATGIHPALPDHLADLFDRPERTETLPNDLAVVEDYVARVSRVG